jgi:glycosyltransferase involved in cell wall biosynthesis
MVPKSEVPRTLSSADVLVYTFRKLQVLQYGTSSAKIFEYLASGRPIVYAMQASNDPVREANAGITVEPENSKAIASAIIAMANMSDAERKSMGRRGYEFACKHYDIHVLAERLEKSLTSVL